MEQKKITQEELEKLQSLDKSKYDIIFKIGQIKLEVSFLQKRIGELNEIEKEILHEYDIISTNINDISKELEEKYGNGVINLQTGLITPQ